MMENVNAEPQVEKKAGAPGWLGELGWLFSGAVLPMGSATFYRKAVQRSVGGAILFFLLFTLVISILSTITIGVNMFLVIAGIQQAYANGEVPQIVIRNGIAEVDGPQPFILIDDSTPSTQPSFVAVDTSGEINEIDTQRYDQGFLLTRTELHIVNQQGDYQVLPLAELNTAFEKDPIIINGDTVSRAWGALSVFVVIFMFIFLVLWHSLLRLMIIATIALVIWGIVSLAKPNTGFGPIIISGLYAIVPAIYFSHLFSRAGVSFPGLQTFFLMIFWTAGLILCLADLKFLPDDQPLRLWTALIGLPMLILYSADMIWQIPAPYGAPILWVVTFLTVLVLVGLRIFLRFGNSNIETPAA